MSLHGLQCSLAVRAEAYLHDGYAHQELLHLAQQALDVFPGPHAQLRRGAPVELADGAQRRQTRHPARRHPQRLSARLEQEICRLQASPLLAVAQSVEALGQRTTALPHRHSWRAYHTVSAVLHESTEWGRCRC